jgi:molecular chaperone GrpE (heat shock protein)
LNGVFSKIFDRIEDPQGRFAFNLQRSLLKGLLSIYDLLQDLEGNTEKELSDKEHRANYGTIRMQMFQLFAFNDIKPIIPEAGAKMDAQFHRAVEVVLTGEPEEDNCIEKCIRDGFIYGSIVLRPAEVIVRKYSTEAVLTNDSTVDEN